MDRAVVAIDVQAPHATQDRFTFAMATPGGIGPVYDPLDPHVRSQPEQKEQQPLRFARVRPWWGRQTWLFHETSTYSKIDSLSGSFPRR